MSKPLKFSEMLIAFRSRTGLSQAQLGEKLGVSRNYVSMLEGGRQPSESLRRLAELLFESPIYNQEPGETARTPQEKVVAAMRKAGLNAAQLAKKIGRAIGPVQAVIERGARASEGMIEDFCRVLPDLEKGDLMEGSESVRVLQEHGGHGMVGQKPSITLPRNIKGRYVPLLSFAQAGRYNVAAIDSDWDGEGFIAFDIEDRSAFALRVEGDSMSPQIAPGDVVVVSPSMNLRRGDTVVVRTTDGEVFCKVWGGYKDDAAVFLSTNVAHMELRFPREQIAWIYPVAQHTRTTRRS